MQVWAMHRPSPDRSLGQQCFLSGCCKSSCAALSPHEHVMSIISEHAALGTVGVPWPDIMRDLQRGILDTLRHIDFVVLHPNGVCSYGKTLTSLRADASFTVRISTDALRVTGFFLSAGMQKNCTHATTLSCLAMCHWRAAARASVL
jgi:hypothetical protein